MKLLVMGLPGAGKTYLAKQLTALLNGIHLNADRVRATINSDLGFSPEDRVEHARRMGWMAQLIKESGHLAIADFVCPTPETRAAFGADVVIWMDTITVGRFEDTNRLFVPPANDIHITDWNYDPEAIVSEVAAIRKVLYL
jgi:hypothetical protein